LANIMKTQIYPIHIFLILMTFLLSCDNSKNKSATAVKESNKLPQSSSLKVEAEKTIRHLTNCEKYWIRRDSLNKIK